MRARLRHLGRDQRGSVAVMSAVVLPCVFGCMALAIDVASMHLERRTLQGLADLAAISAADQPEKAEEIVQNVLAVNNAGSKVAARVEVGSYTATSSLPVANRFGSVGESNAVRVEMEKTASIYFARVFYSGAGPLIRVEATAARENIAQFSIGSRLLSLDGGLANALLSGLFGTRISLRAMDYTALAAADLDLVSLLKGLATEASVSAGTYEELLDSALHVDQILNAAAVVASSQGQGAADIALRQLAGNTDLRRLGVTGRKVLNPGDIGSLSVGETPSGVAAKISAYDLVRATAQAAGTSQIKLDLGLQVPTLAGLTATITLGEPPQNSSWITTGPEGTIVHTAQTRVRLNAELGTIKGFAPLVSLPVMVDIAAADAKLQNITCGKDPATDATATLLVQPSLAAAWIGEPKSEAAWNEFSAPDIRPATVLNVLGLVKVNVSAGTPAQQEFEAASTFSAAEISRGEVKTVPTSRPLGALFGALFTKPQVSAQALGLGIGLGLGGIEDAVFKLVQPAGAVLDPVLAGLLRALGIGVGEADVRVHAIRCGQSSLVM
ncbi:pilus assembly protein TadG-related protein [Terrihabitans rhizophilus]|uniref:Pilus assembly protein TadG-related protein n=1 Tax=Terrihabitans rhizophilus TaxID=3092662 RepID=A0ABU4RS63_9HYPH|nr:pilus assembly protein TadG-related protein [Terrihabitans sp. PJ23]MDX6806919.1 pilus assembly protein TadG-related protein [Terrihabitans sp. PJ23]